MKKKSVKINLRDSIITTIIVTQNDEEIIEGVLNKTYDVLSKNYPNYEVLIVDNNSDDGTVSKIRSLHKKIPHIRIIRLSKTYHWDITYTAGLDNCVGDYALLFDIHIFSPTILPLLLDRLLEGYDIVTTKCKEMVLPKLSTSRIFLSFIEKVSSHNFNYEPIYLFGLNRKAINSITRIRRKNRNFSYISNSIGFKHTTIEFQSGKIGYPKVRYPNFFELLVTVADIIISNSFKPMRLLAALGMLISLSFLFYVVIVVVFVLFFNTYFAPRGWVTLASIMGIMFFLLFSLLTLLSEYIIRVLNESRNEPLYFIAEEMDKSVITIKRNQLNVV